MGHRLIIRRSLRQSALTLAIALWLTAATAAPRLAVLDPGHADILQALGAADTLVLMPADPAFANDLSNVSRYQRMPSMEGLLATRPSLLIAGNPGRDTALRAQATRLGIPTTMVARTDPPIKRIQRLAAITNHETAGQRLIARTRAAYARARALMGHAHPRLLHISSAGAGTTGAITGAGAGTAAHGLIRRVGAINVGATAGLERYQGITPEGMIAMAPQAVVVSDLELAPLGGREGIWQTVPGLALTPAAKHHALIVLPHRAIKFDAAASGAATLALAQKLVALSLAGTP